MNFSEIKLQIKTNFKVVYVLIALNVLLYLITVISSLFFGKSFDAILYIFGADYFPSIIGDYEVFRLVTSAFLHGNLIHLMVNIWALWSIGSMVENFYGGKKLFTTYIITAITSSLFSNIVTFISIWISGDISSSSISVGASGALFGLVGLILGNKHRKNTYSVSMDMYIDTYQLWTYVVFNVIIGFGFNFFGTGSFAINNWAHIGGLIGGLILGILLEPINSFYVSKIKKTFELFLFLFSIFAYFASMISLFVFIFINLK